MLIFYLLYYPTLKVVMKIDEIEVDFDTLPDGLKINHQLDCRFIDAHGSHPLGK